MITESPAAIEPARDLRGLRDWFKLVSYGGEDPECSRPQLEGVLEFKNARKPDFPIQQNALMALSLIGIMTLLGRPEDKEPRCLIVPAVFAGLGFAIRSGPEFRGESSGWQQAAAALRQGGRS